MTGATEILPGLWLGPAEAAEGFPGRVLRVLESPPPPGAGQVWIPLVYAMLQARRPAVQDRREWVEPEEAR